MVVIILSIVIQMNYLNILITFNFNNTYVLYHIRMIFIFQKYV